MLRTRLALPLALLSIVALATPALAVGVPVALPTEIASGLPAAAATAEATVTKSLPPVDATASDPVLREVDGLLAQAQEKAQLAARHAHTAEAAKARLDRLQTRAAGSIGAEATAGAASPDRLPERALAHAMFAHDRALVEAEAARADGFTLVEAAKAKAEARATEAHGVATSDVQARLAERLAKVEARAGAFAATDPTLALGLAQRALDAANARLAEARATDDEDAIAKAERLVAFAEKKVAKLEERVEAWSARAEAEGSATFDAPAEAPFRQVANARGAVAPVTSRLK